jgi:predicted DNA-binding protein
VAKAPRSAPTSIRLSAEGRQIRDELAAELGVTKSAIHELALRALRAQQRLANPKPGANLAA